MADRSPQPLDGGWGWVVVAAGFCIYVFMVGIIYSLGVLTAELVDEFQASRQLTGWIFSIMTGITMGAGPVASVASTKFGIRPVVMAGAAIGSLGFAVSFFVTEAWMLIITIGCIVGLGMSFMYLPTLVAVGTYFHRLRSTAIGIVVCGSGVGSFIFSPLISFLIQTYSWRGAVLILSAILLNCAVFGSLFRPLPLITSPAEAKGFITEAENGDGEAKITDEEETFTLQKHEEATILRSPDHKQINRKLSSVPDVGQEQLKGRCGLDAVARNRSLSTGCMLRSCASSAKTSTWDCARKQLSGLVDLSLLRKIYFVLFVVSNLLSSMGYHTPFLFVPDRAQQAGFSRTHSSLLVSIIGISNMIGRLTFGILSDRKWVNKLMLYNTALAIAGAVLVFSFVSNAYAFMAVYCALFGIFIGTCVMLETPVLVDLVGLDKLSSSLGLLMFFQSIGVFAGPPFAGFLFDSTRSFDASFAVCGVCIFVSGVMLYPAVWALRHQRGLESKPGV